MDSNFELADTSLNASLDYDNAIHITSFQNGSNQYTAPSNGILYVSVGANGWSSVIRIKNSSNEEVVIVQVNTAWSCVPVPLKKNQSINVFLEDARSLNVYFVPYA